MACVLRFILTTPLIARIKDIYYLFFPDLLLKHIQVGSSNLHFFQPIGNKNCIRWKLGISTSGYSRWCTF
jgi:hypothetical protein